MRSKVLAQAFSRKTHHADSGLEGADPSAPFDSARQPSRIVNATFPADVLLKAGEGGSKKDSVTLLDQILFADKEFGATGYKLNPETITPTESSEIYS